MRFEHAWIKRSVAGSRHTRILSLLFLFVLASCTSPLLKSPRELEFKTLEVAFPQVEQVTLKNGMEVYLLEEHELPLFGGQNQLDRLLGHLGIL